MSKTSVYLRNYWDMKKTKRMLTDNEHLLLLYLIEHGSRTKYALEKETISKKLFGSKGTISHLLRKLIDKMVVETKTPDIKQVRPKKFHLPTIFGLAYIISEEIHEGPSSVYWDKERFHNMIRNNVELLPLIFGKWDLFVKEGVQDSALHRFYLSCRYLIDSQPMIMRKTPDPRNWQPAFLQRALHPNPEYQSDWFITPLDEIFSAYFFSHSIVSVMKERTRVVVERAVEQDNMRWIEICASDSEIHEFVSNSWKMALDSYSHTVRNLEKALELLIL